MILAMPGAVHSALSVPRVSGDDPDLTILRDSIEAAIPLSPGNYNTWQLGESAEARVRELATHAEETNVDLSHSPKWRQQLWSLGGGNHFIELCLDELDRVWMFLHSGSRGVGNLIARKHVAAAQNYCLRNWIKLPDPDLAYLVEGTLLRCAPRRTVLGVVFRGRRPARNSAWRI